MAQTNSQTSMYLNYKNNQLIKHWLNTWSKKALKSNSSMKTPAIKHIFWNEAIKHDLMWHTYVQIIFSLQNRQLQNLLDTDTRCKTNRKVNYFLTFISFEWYWKRQRTICDCQNRKSQYVSETHFQAFNKKAANWES